MAGKGRRGAAAAAAGSSASSSSSRKKWRATVEGKGEQIIEEPKPRLSVITKHDPPYGFPCHSPRCLLGDSVMVALGTSPAGKGGPPLGLACGVALHGRAHAEADFGPHRATHRQRFEVDWWPQQLPAPAALLSRCRGASVWVGHRRRNVQRSNSSVPK